MKNSAALFCVRCTDTAKRTITCIALTAGLLFLHIPLSAQVSQQELQGLGPVEFINYEGPMSRIETRVAIRDTGAALGSIIRGGGAQAGSLARYFVINSRSGADASKLDADIFGLGIDVSVDHIRNLRFIVQGYLESAYQYSEADASLLAEFITIYNAVYRGAWDFVVSRYKTPVIGHLTQEQTGLSLRYDEWPGQTLMLIPIGAGLGGPLSSVDTAAISDPRVIDQLREEPDRGVAQRQGMVDLMEREAESAAQLAASGTENIQQEERQIARERQEAQQAERQVEALQNQIAQDRQNPNANQQVLNEQAAVAARQQQEVQQQQASLVQREEALDAQRDQVQRQAAFAEQRNDQAQQQRQQIADDQQALLAQEPPAPEAQGTLGLSILTRDACSSIGRLVLVDPATGRETRRSPITTVDVRTVTRIDNKLLAIAGENRNNSAIRLVEINASTLEMTAQGNDDIAQGSLLWVNGQNLYAITVNGGNFYMARFNTNMVLQNRSAIAIHPFASLLFDGQTILTQRADGSPLFLNAQDLTEKR